MADYSAEMDKAQGNQLALAGQRLQNQQAQQGMADDQAARQASIASGGDQNKLLQLLQQGGNYKGAQALQKSMFDSQKVQADTKLSTSHAANFDAHSDTIKADAQYKAHDQNLQQLQGVSTPDEMMQWIRSGIGGGGLDLGKGAALAQQLQSDPGQFQTLKDKMLATGVAIQEKAKIDAENARNAANNATSVANNTANNTTSAANNEATNRTHVQTTGMTNATSRANNAATQAGENTRASLMRSNQLTINGLDGQGNILGGGAGGNGLDGLVKGIGTGQVPQAIALARMPAGIKAQVLAKVAEQYPDYDPTDMAQRNRAAVAFGTGPQGNSVRSFNVSLSHLDTLSNLSDALNNGNMQLVNKIGNMYTQQTGSAAPVNFEAAKKIVTDEIVKAIVGGGGGVSDREAAAATVSKASSPAQLKGVISTYKELMTGQLQGLERQYQATTGRTDFRTKFMSPNAQAQAGGGASDLHTQADAILRGGK